MPTEISLKIASRCWPTSAVPDPVLLYAFAQIIDEYRSALIWCSGADEFQPGGEARAGWERGCLPLLQGTLYLSEENSVDA